MICNNDTTFIAPQPYQIYINAATNLIIALFGIFGNFMIIFMYIRFKHLRNFVNTAITFLSMNDFMRSSIVMTGKIYNQIRFIGRHKRPEIAEPYCKISGLVIGFTCCFSTTMLAFISVLRYLLISPKYIGKDMMTRTKFFVTVIAMVVFAVTFAALPLMGIKGMGVYRYSQSHGVCFADWCDRNRNFRIVFYVIVSGIAWPVLTVAYLTLFCVYHKHNKELVAVMEATPIRTYKENDGCKINLLDDCDEQEGLIEPSHSKLLQSDTYLRVSKQENRLTRLLLVLFLAYVVCWLPALVINILGESDTVHVPIIWFYIIDTMVCLKSALDPILYGFGNKNYRKALTKTSFRTSMH